MDGRQMERGARWIFQDFPEFSCLQLYQRGKVDGVIALNVSGYLNCQVNVLSLDEYISSILRGRYRTCGSTRRSIFYYFGENDSMLLTIHENGEFTLRKFRCFWSVKETLADLAVALFTHESEQGHP
jgi:hypothetical protein